MSGKKTISNITPAIGAIQIQQSTYGTVIPIVWGTTRIAGNLIWYGDFKAVPHTTTTQTGGKGGGSGTQTQNTTYTYTASVAMALCEGPVLDVLTTWRGKNIFSGQSYNGAAAQETDTATYPASGTTVTVQNTNGWRNISVQVQVQSAYQDDFTYNRAGSWVTLAAGRDYTCANGVYTFTNSAQYQGAPIRINYTFASGRAGSSCLSEIGLELHSGTPGQAPWAYLSSTHPAQALGYSGVAYVAGANYGLDSGASVENHAFEIRTSFAISSGVPDADPSRIVQDALTNPLYGVNFGLEKIAPLTDYSNACLAQGIVLSPALTEQSSAADFLTAMSQLTNVGMVWSGGTLKMVPYSDTQLSGNGVTYTPNTAPIYDLTDDDFQPVDDEGPVKVTRGAVSDSFNSVKLEFFDRANDYNIAIMPATDGADIQENGARPMSTLTAHWITDANVAKVVAQLILQRSLFVRNTYEFTLGWTKIGLEPMDLVTLTDPNLGLNKQPVRVLSVEEDDTGLLAVTAEDFPKGSASATLYPTGSGTGYSPNFNEPPGSMQAPMMFEGPAALASQNGGLEVWLAAGSASPTYGGCEVWVSVSGSNYQRAATINGSSRFGVTTSVMPTAASGAVTSDTLGVRLFAGGQLLSGTADDMNALTTLCYVDGEYFAYQNSTLTGASAYTVGNQMVRGAYLSRSFNSHALGINFIRCDDAIAKMPLTPDYIGKTLHIKLLPFNRFGGGLGSLADATEYTYTVTGWQANLPPIAPMNLGTEGPFTIDTAKFKWDRIGSAASYNVQIWAGSPAVMVREVNAGNALRYDYSANDAKSDGGPWRSVTIKVQGINGNGAAGAFSSYTATNPQVGALTNAKVASNSSAVQFTCDRPADSDFSGIQVWISPTSGFTPGASTLVYDGPTNSVTINRLHDNSQLTLGATYYVRAAAYDTFGLDGMTITAELPVAIANTTGVQTATVFLYQWALSAPAVPTGTSVYTWSNGVNANYIPAAGASPPDVWTLAAGNNPGTPLMRLYVATLAVTAAVGTTTSTLSYVNATVSAWSQNGSNGASGVQAGAAIVYAWAATIPGGPAGAATYTWAGGTFGAAPTSPDGTVWHLTSGNSPSAGMTLWQAKVALTDSAANATTAFNWTAAGVSAIGYAGGTGASYVTAYCASSTASATGAPAPTPGKTSLPAANSGGITGTWSPTVPALVAGQFMYQSDGIYDPSTDKVTWSTPYWSSLKVGSLSAITANLGQITAGDINIGNGMAHIDSTGAAVFKAITIQDTSGNVILQSGGQLALSAAPAGTLNSAVTLPSLGQNSFRAVATGASNSTPTAAPGLYINGVIAYGSNRSYNFARIRRSDGVVTFFKQYDVFGLGAVTGGAKAYDLAADLNATGPDYLVVVWTYDEPQGNRFNDGLPAAMYRCGASRAIFGSSQFVYRSAYVLIGIGGCGEGNGSESYQGSIPSDPNAWVDVGFSLLNGTLSVSPSYTPRTLTDYGYVGDLNATVGATIGQNLFGQLNSGNISTYIAGAAIGLAQINTASIGSLSALSATIGTLDGGVTSGGRTVLAGSGVTVYATDNGLRIELGKLV